MALRMAQLICILCCWKVVADAGRMMMIGLWRVTIVTIVFRWPLNLGQRSLLLGGLLEYKAKVVESVRVAATWLARKVS